MLSLKEEKNIHAPIAEGFETDMSDFANAYSEGALKNWTVPTEDEARSLKKEYGGNYEELNLIFGSESINGDTISVSTSSNNARYLCAEGTKTFNFAANGSITSAGKSTKYRLRLVKKIHVVVK